LPPALRKETACINRALIVYSIDESIFCQTDSIDV
jgi:hypothetical protein